MKIRSDFVTNSSSTSYIVAIKGDYYNPFGVYSEDIDIPSTEQLRRIESWIKGDDNILNVEEAYLPEDVRELMGNIIGRWNNGKYWKMYRETLFNKAMALYRKDYAIVHIEIPHCFGGKPAEQVKEFIEGGKYYHSHMVKLGSYKT